MRSFCEQSQELHTYPARTARIGEWRGAARRRVHTPARAQALGACGAARGWAAALTPGCPEDTCPRPHTPSTECDRTPALGAFAPDHSAIRNPNNPTRSLTWAPTYAHALCFVYSVLLSHLSLF